MSDSDLIDLYSGQILALAADIPNAKRLQSYDGSARKRSPLCGSTVTVDVKMDGNRIADFGQDVKACALGQAAASIIGQVIIGLDKETIANGFAELEAMLKSDGPTPNAPFDGFKVLTPARGFKNRHASILLTFDAITAAIEAAQTTKT